MFTLTERSEAAMSKCSFGGIVLVLALGLSGCAYTGGVGEPVARKFTWFSYAAGDDIKAACTTPDAPARYRLIYNANWNEQVRAYDMRRFVIPGGGAILDTHVFGGYGGNVSNFSLSNVSEPWQGPAREVKLEEDQYLALIRAVEASGFGGPAPEGLRLESWDSYWLVSACAAGQFHFNAWKFPSDRWSKITFDKLLFAADGTGARVNPPKELDHAEQFYLSSAQNAKYYGYTFQFIVGKDGLVGRLPPL
jgi:hypothetical protein